MITPVPAAEGTPPAPAPAAPVRPLRRDAAQNRQRLLAAASEVFAAHGPDAGVEEIARSAGVGMGTLYRRFPTKQALIDELVGEFRRELLDLARGAAERDDGTGLEQFLVSAGKLQAMRSACLAELWHRSDAVQDAMDEVRAILADLLAAAKQHDRVREDVTSTDIAMVLLSVRDVLRVTRDVAPQAWRRHLELLIAGMRPVGDRTFGCLLKEKPLTEVQVRRIGLP